MEVLFRLHYATVYGEELHLVIDRSEERRPMQWQEGNWWVCRLDVPAGQRPMYHYEVWFANTLRRCERGRHQVRLAAAPRSCIVQYDLWTDFALPQPLNDAVPAQLWDGEAQPEGRGEHQFHVAVDALVPLAGCHLALVGSDPSLGAWNPLRALPLTPTSYGHWQAEFSPENTDRRLEFKVVVFASDGQFAGWEEGENHSIDTNQPGSQAVALTGVPLRWPLMRQPLNVCHVDLATLRSDRRQGIGDLGDVLKLAQWCVRVGFTALLLGLEHYSAADGATGLHPAYLNVDALPVCGDKRWLAAYHRHCLLLDKSDAVDFDAAASGKQRYVDDLRNSGVTLHGDHPAVIAARQLSAVARRCGDMGVELLACPVGLETAVAAESGIYSLQHLVALNPDFPQSNRGSRLAVSIEALTAATQFAAYVRNQVVGVATAK